MKRREWKIEWRRQRIVRRESLKATLDQIIFGTGFVKYGAMGEFQRDGSDVARHIPADQVFLTLERGSGSKPVDMEPDPVV